ncbi:hypothetical protein PV326_007380 [Microctonus aethiopoides]|nr:hypothetical protein PV326_007380 [Microctonus aethiopoides]
MNEIITQIKYEEKVRQSEAVYRKLLNLSEYQTSKRISLYLSTDNEVNTFPVLKHIFESNKEAFVPKYKGKNMIMVKLKSIEDYDNLPLTKWNIKQPADDDYDRDNAQNTGGLHVIILPGVAFTATG